MNIKLSLFIVVALVSSLYSTAQVTADAFYSISICADVPDNDHPSKVFHKYEPGHVFLVLESRDSITGKQSTIVWGFYPRRPLFGLLFRSGKSKLVNNSGRDYDVSITKTLTYQQYVQATQIALLARKKKYHLNKYNCYDYALEVYNSIDGVKKIPVNKTRFPFLFGKGGSPCVLYKDLKKMESGEIQKESHISFRIGTAVVNPYIQIEITKTVHQQKK